MNPRHYAPTWNWASVDGPISHVSATPMEDWAESDPIHHGLEVRKLNAASGLITFVGRIISAELSCRVEIDNTPGKESNLTKEKKFSYHYEVLGVYKEGKLLPVTADVPLKPWSGNINGQYISTVIRSPYGEAIPEKSWTAPCLCLIVSKTKMRSIVLFLGASLRESGLGNWLGWWMGCILISLGCLRDRSSTLLDV
jgi:hypothetical protein